MRWRRWTRSRARCASAPFASWLHCPRERSRPQPQLERAASGRIHIFQAGPADDESLVLTESLVRLAGGLVGEVEFSPANGACTPIDGVVALVAAALRGGAKTILLADTVGRALPEDVMQRMRELRSRLAGLAGVCLSFHGHDDLGLATANTLAAIRAGARQVEVAVNGLGARAGNAALEEVVVALNDHRAALGALTGVDVDALVALSRLVEERSKLAVSPQKAIVGRHVRRRARHE